MSRCERRDRFLGVFLVLGEGDGLDAADEALFVGVIARLTPLARRRGIQP
jgi:hypothetical protein